SSSWLRNGIVPPARFFPDGTGPTDGSLAERPVVDVPVIRRRPAGFAKSGVVVFRWPLEGGDPVLDVRYEVQRITRQSFPYQTQHLRHVSPALGLVQCGAPGIIEPVVLRARPACAVQT